MLSVILLNKIGFYIEYWKLLKDDNCKEMLSKVPEVETELNHNSSNGKPLSVGYASFLVKAMQINRIKVSTSNCIIVIESPKVDIVLSPPSKYGLSAETEWLEWTQNNESEEEYAYLVQSIDQRDGSFILPRNGQFSTRDRRKTTYEIEYERLRRIQPYSTFKEALYSNPTPFVRALFFSRKALVTLLYRLQWKCYYLNGKEVSLFEVEDKNGQISSYFSRLDKKYKTILKIYDGKHQIEQTVEFYWSENKPDRRFVESFISSYKCLSDIPFYEKNELLGLIQEGLNNSEFRETVRYIVDDEMRQEDAVKSGNETGSGFESFPL
jgi:hypothetical protein